MDMTSWPIWANLIVFAVSGGAVWIAGTRMSEYAAVIGARTGMGQAFAGMLLLGGATSLPELATVSTSAFYGDAGLAVNSILGSVAMQVLLLALADAVLGRDALTSVVAAPATLLQGTFDILLMTIALIGIAAGEFAVLGTGLCALAVLPVFLLSVLLSAGYAERAPWQATGRQSNSSQQQGGHASPEAETKDAGLSRTVAKALIASGVLLVAGFVLSRGGDVISKQTGLDSGMIGFVLVGISTSLPEVSSVVGAMRQKNYELAIGDIFGTNMFDIALIPIADIIYRKGAILKEAGPFETVAALLGILLTAVYLVGLLERRDRTILRMGYDSLAAIVIYAIGLGILYSLSG
ncbi:MAG: sodium:calcium antiporter [Hyphomicrobiaceae bacterium]|nr:sodium:calcium antiporter [Hyphomicrobiaceae bacterium]